MASITIFVSDGEYMQEFYWIAQESGKALGWFYGKDWHKVLGVEPLPGFDFHYHFNYPKDGNVHFSVKLLNKVSREEQYLTFFHDKVKVKTIKSGLPIIEEINRNECKNEAFNTIWHMLNVDRCEAFKELNVYAFPILNIPIIKGIVKLDSVSKKPITECKITDKDILIDCTKYKEKTLNLSIGARLHRNDTDKQIPFDYRASIKITTDLTLTLYGLLHPLEIK